MPVLAWVEDGHLHCARLAGSGSTRIGREQQPPDIRIDPADRTVSRLHAEIRLQGGQAVIENRSSSNPLKVGGVPMAGAHALSDGESVEMGTVRVTYHDVAQARQLSGLTCNHCGRDNEATAKDCWFCGQNLVNAPSVLLRNRLAACRVVSLAGEAATVFPNTYAALMPDGTLKSGRGDEAPAGALAVVAAREDGAPIALGQGATINGAPLAGETAIVADSLLAAGNTEALVLLP